MVELTKEHLQELRACFSSLSVPSNSSKVYKDECLYSFTTSFHPDGLYVNLHTFQCVSKEFLDLNFQQNTQHRLFLHLCSTRVLKESVAKNSKEDKPTKLGIGINGGFSSENDQEDIFTKKSIVLLPKHIEFDYPNTNLPEFLSTIIEAVLAHTSQEDKNEIKAWQEEIKETKYAADLVQLPIQEKISPDPKRWVCFSCGKKENLWLNLSDGYIGCGRKNWDGSGGCGASLDHYVESGSQFPLSVKLGTITADGADVFSYAADENDMVINPHLSNHLSHFGIDLLEMKKTEKTMIELQIDLNKGYEFDKITEAGKDLIPLHGPHYIGLKNLGNTCYMNSVLQILYSIPEIQTKYLQNHQSIIQTAKGNIATDFLTQMSKLAIALLTNKYMDPKDKKKMTTDIQPRLFKALVGKDHPEFSSSRQQDGMEFFSYLIDFMQKEEHTHSSRLPQHGNSLTSSIFQFMLEDRIQCSESKKVKYVQRKESVLHLPIPIEDAINSKEFFDYKESEKKRQKVQGEESKSKDKKEPIQPIVPFEKCLQAAFSTEMIDNFFSSALHRKTRALKRYGFITFPKYLVIQMRRYYVGEDWMPKKLEALVSVPEVLDLTSYRSSGLQENEKLLPEEEKSSSSSSDNLSTSIQPDENLVTQLCSMGFSENGSKRAAIATQNGSAEQAMEWIFAHVEDPDFDLPIVEQSHDTNMIDTQHVDVLTSMGFTDVQAQRALKETNGDVERAAEWLFSRMDDLNTLCTEESTTMTTETERVCGEHGHGKYRLMGFISHMGSNTGCGHYVCHIKKDGQWVLFNDQKVAISKDTPLDMGYLYFFQREA